MNTVQQNIFIDKICNKASTKELLNYKLANSRIPNSLLKFYSPEEYNFIDIESQLLWLSAPTTFNDPFDCKIAFNRDEYTKYFIINYILNEIKTPHLDSRYHFTKEDLHKIYKTKDTSCIDHHGYNTHTYCINSVLYLILEEKNKIFRNKIYNIIDKNNSKIQASLKSQAMSDKRIACFCAGDYDLDTSKQNLMWAHYAKSHTGFCVEYDVDLIKRRIDISNSKEESILINLFKVHYTKHRIHLPKTIIKRIIENKLKEKDLSIIEKKWLRTYVTKSTIWKYENEWRLILDSKDYNSSFKIHFPYATSIRIGCNASKKTTERLVEIGRKLNIKVFTAKIDENIYGINGFYPECSYFKEALDRIEL